MHKRVDKVAEAIHELISELLVKGVKDPRIGFVTVTGVTLTDDMHLARVHVTVLGDETQKKASMAGLNSARGYFRSEMGKRFHMRYVPDLLFQYDSSLEYGERIDSLLKEIAVTEEPDD